MIFDLKIFPGKIKERKGKYLLFPTKKTFSTKIWPSTVQDGKDEMNFHISLVKPYLMKWQEFVRDYLAFSRKERIGIIVILILMLLIIFLPKIVITRSGSKSYPIDTTWTTQIKKLDKKQVESDKHQFSENNDVTEYQYDRTKNKYNEPIKGELFYFDPNKLSADGWKKLGLRDKTIQTIQNYLSKGGRFKKPEDLQRIYGLKQDEYDRIATYIQIETLPTKKEEEIVNVKSTLENTTPKTFTSHYSIIDINTADTTAFIALPGIGSKLAARIVNFREKLGGFYSVDQVGETFGLPDSTFQKIKQYLKLENVSLKKININTATIDELKVHPYIRWSIANPIVAYRNEHGVFSNLEEIKKVAPITEDVYKKISPYLVIQ